MKPYALYFLAISIDKYSQLVCSPTLELSCLQVRSWEVCGGHLDKGGSVASRWGREDALGFMQWIRGVGETPFGDFPMDLWKASFLFTYVLCRSF